MILTPSIREQGFDTSVPSPGSRIPGAFPGGLNANLQSAMLRHRHFLLMAENGSLRDLLGPLREARSSLMDQLRRTAEREGALGNLGLMMDQRRRFLRTRIDGIMAIARVETTDQMQSILQEIAEKEQQVQANILRREIPGQVSLDLVGPDIARLQGMVNQPLGGARFADRLRKNYGEMTVQLKNQLGASIVLGEGMDQAARRLRNVMEDLGVHRSTVLARSEIQRVANQTAMDLYQRNSDVIKGMQWVGTLDDRTCLICGNLDGEFYELSSPPSFPPPAHPQCRCFLSPVTKSWQELGIDREEMPAGTRASMDGQVPASTNYEEWFATQSPDFQRGVLGPTRFEKYKTGQLDISDFADVKSARVIPVKELPDTVDVGQTAAQQARAGGGSVRGFDPRLAADEARAADKFLVQDLQGVRAPTLEEIPQPTSAWAKRQVTEDLGERIQQDFAFRKAFDDLVDQRKFADDIKLTNLPARGTINVRGTNQRLVDWDDFPTDVRQKLSGVVSEMAQGRAALGDVTRVLAEAGDVARPAVEALERLAGQRLASNFVGTWASTSADANPIAQALQLAAKREFGLDDAVTSHFKSAVGTIGRRNLTLQEINDQFGDFLQRFQRAQYEVTQEALEAAGIENVTVFRGMRFDEIPAWVPDGGGVVDDIVLQPASSFSSTFGTAAQFGKFSDGGVLVGVRVPASRVLSTARSGFGCLHEGEYVILGGEFEAFAIPIGRKAGTYAGGTQSFQAVDMSKFFDLARAYGYTID